MINVLFPAMGKSAFFKDYYFPKPLIEVNGKTMIEMTINDYVNLELCKFIFVFSDDDCRRFHIDDSAKMLSPDCEVLTLHNDTAGALCTCLMAIEYINSESPLIIANYDQVIDIEYGKVIDYFNQINADAGIITFPNIHPRWSYARVSDEEIVEVAEKRPISKDAIAGFYYFRKGKDFVQAAKNAVLKQNHLEGCYYISASLNEMILMGKKIGFYGVNKEQYHSFYSPTKIKEYEEKIK